MQQDVQTVQSEKCDQVQKAGIVDTQVQRTCLVNKQDESVTLAAVEAKPNKKNFTILFHLRSYRTFGATLIILKMSVLIYANVLSTIMSGGKICIFENRARIVHGKARCTAKIGFRKIIIYVGPLFLFKMDVQFAV